MPSMRSSGQAGWSARCVTTSSWSCRARRRRRLASSSGKKKRRRQRASRDGRRARRRDARNRSGEGRVGEEGRSWWAAYHLKKKKTTEGSSKKVRYEDTYTDGITSPSRLNTINQDIEKVVSDLHHTT